MSLITQQDALYKASRLSCIEDGSEYARKDVQIMSIYIYTQDSKKVRGNSARDEKISSEHNASD
jgi:hypothetical protein